jgi:hypothetical protein
VACMGDRQGVYIVSIRRPEGKPHLEDLGVDGLILKGYARRRMGVASFECGSEPFSSMKCTELLDWLRNCKFVCWPVDRSVSVFPKHFN